MKLVSKILLFFAICGMLAGTDLRITGANHAEYWVFVDNQLDSLNYKEHLTEKLKLKLHYKDIMVKGVFFFWDPSIAVPGSLQYSDFTAQYRKDPVSVVYGTYYPTFGRGLVLNQFLDEDFNNDNSLFGLKVDLKYFNSRLTLLTGRPRNIFFEELAYSVKNDTTDQIRGANFEMKVPLCKKRVNIVTTFAGRYVRVNRVLDMTPQAFT